MASLEPSDRPLRADARRNLRTLLEAAAEVFTASGVDAPVRDVAERAGLGMGTLYRHFPTRTDLIVAVFHHEVDACADAAPALAAAHAPGEALTRWVDRFVAFLRTKRGLATALHSGDPAYAGLPAYFDQRFRPALASLLDAAAAAGEIRAGVDPNDLLWAVASLCASTGKGGPDLVQRMVAMLLDGLRHGAEPPAGAFP